MDEKRKRGMNHIEIVLAFVIFIVSVSVILYFFIPERSEILTESSLQYASIVIMENVTLIEDNYYVKLESSGNVAVPFPLDINEKVYAEDMSGGRLPAKMSNGNIEIGNSPSIVHLRVSEDFDEIAPTDNTTVTTYKLGSVSSEEVISEKRIIALDDQYDADYLALKKQMNLPDNLDFAFSLSFSGTETITYQRSVPVGVDVFTFYKRANVQKEDGVLQFGELSVKVW